MDNKAETSPEGTTLLRRTHRVIQDFLPDLIYGANDGIVTTLAIVSGVVGAALEPRVILILGFANLIADGFSMGASNFLSKRTAKTASDRATRGEAMQHGLATFLGFITAGFAPLIAYLIPGITTDRFVVAVALALATLFVVGASRALFGEERWLRGGLEMFVIGALAAAVAYAVGLVGAQILNNGAPIA
ncbi:MAG: VIT1/CCC1 transporter family protein [Bacteroidota bacterium]